MYEVEYRCIYREWWYHDSSWYDYSNAYARAMQLYYAGRSVRVLDDSGAVIMLLGS